MPIPKSRFEQTQEPVRSLSSRSFYRRTTSECWSLIWDAGPYYERVVGALEKATSYAIFVGWQIDSRLELSTRRHETFRQLLIRLCTERPDFHIYFLMWDYAYFYIFERELLQGFVWDHMHDRIHFIFDNRHPYGGSHHEKFVVVDGEIAFVGGVDICDDRWDTPHHFFKDSRRSLRHDREDHRPYHDMSVEVRGEVAADLVDYIGERWKTLSSIPFPERPRVARFEARGKYRMLISRTKASVELKKPLLIRETEFLYRSLIRSAQKQLVIENQYYWSRKINEELIALMRARARSGFRLFLAIPPGGRGSLAFRMMGFWQTRLLDALAAVARETGTNLVLGCPFSQNWSGRFEKGIYVHSKVMVVDDRFMAVGSSNFNNRGFRLDTELTLTLVGDSPEARARIRVDTRKLIAHWGKKAFHAFLGEKASEIGLSFEPHIELKPYHDAWDASLKTVESWISKHFPIAKVFDPVVPMNYFWKWHLASKRAFQFRKNFFWAVVGMFLLTLASALTLTALVFSVLQWQGGASDFLLIAICAAILSLSWIFPVPVLLSSFFAGTQLEAGQAGVLVFCSVATSAMFGYLFSRVFPTFASRMCRPAVQESFLRILGRRNLFWILGVMFNPGLGFQEKVACQGIYSIPLRWFAPAGALLAAVLGVIAYSAASLGLLPYQFILFKAGLVLILLTTVIRFPIREHHA